MVLVHEVFCLKRNYRRELLHEKGNTLKLRDLYYTKILFCLSLVNGYLGVEEDSRNKIPRQDDTLTNQIEPFVQSKGSY